MARSSQQLPSSTPSSPEAMVLVLSLDHSTSERLEANGLDLLRRAVLPAAGSWLELRASTVWGTAGYR